MFGFQVMQDTLDMFARADEVRAVVSAGAGVVQLLQGTHLDPVRSPGDRGDLEGAEERVGAPIDHGSDLLDPTLAPPLDLGSNVSRHDCTSRHR
jgi:hypothetical protein